MNKPTHIAEYQAKKKAEMLKRLEHEALGAHIQERVRQPDPVIGWEGNPWFTVVRHEIVDQLEIYYTKPGEEQMVAYAPLDPPPDIGRLLVGLMEWGDNQRKPVEVRMAKIDAHNDKIFEDQNKVLEDELDEAKDRLHLATTKDMGFRGRLY